MAICSCIAYIYVPHHHPDRSRFDIFKLQGQVLVRVLLLFRIWAMLGLILCPAWLHSMSLHTLPHSITPPPPPSRKDLCKNTEVCLIYFSELAIICKNIFAFLYALLLGLIFVSHVFGPCRYPICYTPLAHYHPQHETIYVNRHPNLLKL